MAEANGRAEPGPAAGRRRPPRNAPWAAEGPQLSQGRIDILSLVPLLSIIALVGLVAAVLWAVSRSDAEQARIKLATDALWVEQTLRFQISVDEDMLIRLALETAEGIEPDILDSRTRLHITNNPELVSVIWHGRDGQRLRALPGAAVPGDDALVARLAAASVSVPRPVYGDVDDEGYVTMGVTLPDEQGYLTGTLSLPLLLARHVPWWIAEQYGVRLTDMSEREIAGHKQLEPAENAPSHVISFDPPLRGSHLEITSYHSPPGFRSALLLSAVAGFGLFGILAVAILFSSASRRRLAEMRLLEETAFRRSMEESLTVGLRAKDHEGRILYVNSAFCKLVGYSPAELIGQGPPLPYWDPVLLAETEARQRHLTAGGSIAQSFETRFIARDGRVIDVRVYDAPLIDAAGNHRGWMGSVIDVTETIRAARLARAQDETMARTGRLVTLGEMASTLAHELNQPLAAIASYAAGMMNLIDRDGTDPAMLREVNGKLARQANRAGEIIRRIQDLARKRAPHLTPTNLSDVLTETAGFLQADAREYRVHLKTATQPVPPLHADPILLGQVLINLIRNGMEAMAEQRTSDELQIRLSRDGDAAVFEVQDAGPGISPQIAGKLFDAFASTKAQGMGMGLKICRSIVELHGGHLTHEPAPGGGTIFRVLLPLRDAAGKQDEEATWAA